MKKSDDITRVLSLRHRAALVNSNLFRCNIAVKEKFAIRWARYGEPYLDRGQIAFPSVLLSNQSLLPRRSDVGHVSVLPTHVNSNATQTMHVEFNGIPSPTGEQGHLGDWKVKGEIFR